MTLFRWIGIIGGLLLLLGSTSVTAQSSADAFFHDAAQRYVEGDLQAARRAVERGLEVAPSDPRLRALQQRLEQQERRGGGDGSSRQGGQNRHHRQKSRGKSTQQEQSRESGQESRSQASAPSDRESSGRTGAQSNQKSNNEQSRGSQDAQGGDRQPANALSRAQAARLLRVLENQEMKLLREVQVRAQEGAAVEKDW